MSNGQDMFIQNMEAVGQLAKKSNEHVSLLGWFTDPASDGGADITPTEWRLAIQDAQDQIAKPANEVLVPMAQGLVVLEKLRTNMKHNLEILLALPLKKEARYILRHHLGTVGPRGGPRTKKEAPIGATNSSGLNRQPG